MIGISAVEYVLPGPPVPLSELERRGLLTSPRDVLEASGFGNVHMGGEERADRLVSQAVTELLRRNRFEPSSIDVLLYATALPEGASRARDPISLFRYPATLLQSETGLTHATVSAVSQGGCVSMFAAIRMARGLMTAEPGVNRVLIVGSDFLPPKSRREVLYNVISDGICALSVDRDSPRNRILSYRQVTKGFYWKPGERRNELIASYFPTARRVINEALEEAGTRADEITLLLPHNVNEPSWDVLLGMTGFAAAQLYRTNIRKKGHTISADPLINLRDAADEGRLKRGDRALLFTFGFGAHWAAMVIEH